MMVHGRDEEEEGFRRLREVGEEPDRDERRETVIHGLSVWQPSSTLLHTHAEVVPNGHPTACRKKNTQEEVLVNGNTGPPSAQGNNLSMPHLCRSSS